MDTLDYYEAQKMASEINPNARAILDNGKWIFVINTDFEEDLPEDFKNGNSPAAEAERLNNYGESELARWQRKNGHGGIPYYLVAKKFNLMHFEWKKQDEILSAKLAVHGLAPLDEIIKSLPAEIFDDNKELIMQLRSEAALEAEEFFQLENDILEKEINNSYLTVHGDRN